MNPSHSFAELFKPRPSRVEAFSDGVMAIIITLLVLEIHTPHIHDPLSSQQMSSALIGLSAKFLSFILSFLYIATFWVNHHHFFHFVTHMNRGLMWLNSLLLLFLSFIPFPTALIGEYPYNAAALALFAIILVLAAFVFNLMWRYAARHRLLHESATPEFIQHVSKRGTLGPIIYGVAAAAAFIHPLIAWGIFIFVPVYYFSPSEWSTRELSSFKIKRKE
jgi:uncharacterized membrane protein